MIYTHVLNRPGVAVREPGRLIRRSQVADVSRQSWSDRPDRLQEGADGCS